MPRNRGKIAGRGVKLPRGEARTDWYPYGGHAEADPAGNRAQRRRAKQLGIAPLAREPFFFEDDGPVDTVIDAFEQAKGHGITVDLSSRARRNGKNSRADG